MSFKTEIYAVIMWSWWGTIRTCLKAGDHLTSASVSRFNIACGERGYLWPNDLSTESQYRFSHFFLLSRFNRTAVRQCCHFKATHTSCNRQLPKSIVQQKEMNIVHIWKTRKHTSTSMMGRTFWHKTRKRKAFRRSQCWRQYRSAVCAIFNIFIANVCLVIVWLAS